MIGTVLGNYRIVRKLGQGGMGEVYSAEHRRLPRKAAIKVLVAELSSNAEMVDRLFAEARATATIDHPSIVEILDCDVQDGRAFIVMALLSGESLGTRVRGGGPMPLPQALRFAGQIADGMAAAHDKGIIHRDLKPDNVFLHGSSALGAEAQVKILDFGIAKLVDKDGTMQTRTGVMLGTPTYMSPEQCRGAGKVDYRTDIYALGCILFEMVCGRPPFVREGAGELIAAHIAEPPPRPSELVPGVPTEIDELVRALLAKGVGDRPQSMAEVSRRLSGLLAGGIGAMPASATPAPAVTPKPAAEAGAAAPIPETQRLPSPLLATTPFSSPMQTTLSGAARPMPPVPAPRRWLSLAGAAVVLAGVAALAIALKPGDRKPDAPPPAPVATPVAAPAPPAEPPADRAPAKAEAPPLERPTPPPADVTVDVTGAPAGLTVTVDGTPATLPLKLRRGAPAYTLVFRAPGFRDKTISADGSGDRLLDLTMERTTPPAKKTAASATKKRPGPSTVDYGTTDL